MAAADQVLLSRLKELRLSLAKEQGKPAFVVFADRTLIAMAAQRPQTKEQMLSVNGVGPAKWEKYGDAFLAVCQSSDMR